MDFKNFQSILVKVFDTDTVRCSEHLFKVMLNITDRRREVTKNDAERICDWLKNADKRWISEGHRTSYFCQHFLGNKSREDIMKQTGENHAAFYWDVEKKAFYLSVRCTKDEWNHHLLSGKEKSIDITSKNLDKLVAKELDTLQYTKAKVTVVDSTLFHRETKGATNQSYTVAGSSSGEIASIYVY